MDGRVTLEDRAVLPVDPPVVPGIAGTRCGQRPCGPLESPAGYPPKGTRPAVTALQITTPAAPAIR